MDDGSKDETGEIANRFARQDKRFKYVYQNNSGVSVARNTGIAACNGTYIQFVDADDFLSPRKIELQVTFLDDNEEIDIIYSNNVYFDTANPKLYKKRFDLTDEEWMAKVSGTGQDILKTLLQKNIMVIHAPLIRRSLIDKVGNFDPLLKGMEDWDYWIRCALVNGYFQFDDRAETMVMVRIHPDSASKNSATMVNGEIIMRRSFQKIFRMNSRFKDYYNLNRERLHLCSRHITFEELRFGNWFRGWLRIGQAIRDTAKPGYYLKNAMYWQLNRLFRH